jgi:hypothetical protein
VSICSPLTGGRTPAFSATTLVLSISAVVSLVFAGQFLFNLRAADVRDSNPIFVANEALTRRVKSASAFTPRATVSDVVTKALAFKAMLTTAQQQTLELAYTPALARKWSNRLARPLAGTALDWARSRPISLPRRSR